MQAARARRPAAIANILKLFISYSLIVITAPEITGNTSSGGTVAQGSGVGTIGKGYLNTALAASYDTADGTCLGCSHCGSGSKVKGSAIDALSVCHGRVGLVDICRYSTDECTPVALGDCSMDNLEVTSVCTVADIALAAACNSAKTIDSRRASHIDIALVLAIVNFAGHESENAADMVVGGFGGCADIEFEVNFICAILEHNAIAGIEWTCCSYNAAEAAGFDIACATISCSTTCKESAYTQSTEVVAIGSSLGYGTADTGNTRTCPSVLF